MAYETAEKEVDPRRRAELLKIAEVCAQVPGKPARNWWEAVQSYWMTQVLILCEQRNYGESFGRFDQYMYSYYKKSVIDDQELTREEALELLELSFIKMSENTELYDYNNSVLQPSMNQTWNMQVGGQTRDGRDACNEVTLLALEADEQVALLSPEISFRIWEGTPLEYLSYACEIVRLGRGKPKFYGDRTAIAIMQQEYPDLTMEDYRDYAVIGCVEIASPHITQQHSFTALQNMVKVLDLTIHNGKCSLCGRQIGPQTGDVHDFKFFDDFKEAFRQQTFFWMEHLVKGVKFQMEIQAEWNYSPFGSCLLSGPIEKGKDMIEGGCWYTGFGVLVGGAANVGDSLGVIDTLIYREGKLDWDTLIEALDANWDGFERLRQMAINEVPKYGNDIDYADSMVAFALDTWCDSIDYYNNFKDMLPSYGGKLKGCILIGNGAVAMGSQVGATPDGREFPHPLADTLSPAQGRDVSGASAYRYEGGSIYNSRFPKPTALEKVTGLCDYGDDIGIKMPPGTLHLAVVQPEAIHARILRVNTSEAEQVPGVVKVLTAADIKGGNKCDCGAPNHGYVSPVYEGFTRPIINGDKIYRYGDVVAVVAAFDRDTAREAAKLVTAELEELPAYLTAPEALRPDALQIHENGPENLFEAQRIDKGPDTRESFKNAAYVTEGSFYSQRQPHLVLEPDVMQAYVDKDGVLTLHTKSQFVYGQKMQVAKGLGLPEEKVRVIQNPTGSSFGYTMSPTMAAMTGACALVLNAPVSLTLSYKEHQAYTGKRSAYYENGKMACDENGKLIGLEFEAVFDVGSYNEVASNYPFKACHFYGFPYNIPSVNGLSKVAFSNNANAITFRGYGMPQIYTAGEALIDMLAEKAGIDPFEFRYRNLLQLGDTISTNVCPYEYPSQEMMDLIRPHYEEAKERAKRLSGDMLKRGVGVACGGYSVSRLNDVAEVALELNPDGSVTNYNTWEQMGQGADIGAVVHTHEALRPLGLRPDQIKLVSNDTLLSPNTGSSAGSRQHYMAGNAILDAAKKMMDAMRKTDGTYRSYDEMVAEGIPTKYFGRHTVPDFRTHYVDTAIGYGRNVPEFNYIVQIAEVEVDTNTGKTKILASKGIANVGIVGNYLAVEGQAYGGWMHNVGFALSEDYCCDEKRHMTMIGSGFPQCNDINDDIEFDYHVTPRPLGPHGSVGCSEVFQSCGHMAVINAINNAIGVRIYDLPAKPGKVLEALKAKTEGSERKPGPYYLGADFYETYDRLTTIAEELKKGLQATH